MRKNISLRSLVDLLDSLASKIEFSFNKFGEQEKDLFLKVVDLSQQKISKISFFIGEHSSLEVKSHCELFTKTLNSLVNKSKFNLNVLYIFTTNSLRCLKCNKENYIKSFFKSFEGIKTKKLLLEGLGDN